MTLIHPTPVLIVGTYDKEGRPNAMTVAWGGICCSRPPCVSVSLRKATYSYGNIMERKAFSISIPSEDHVREADYFGIASGRNENKFAATGLTPESCDHVDAPYVKEFPLVLECRLIRTILLGRHTQFIGQILDVKADDSVLDERGIPDMEKVKPIAFAPVSLTYYRTGPFLGKAFSLGKNLRRN